MSKFFRTIIIKFTILLFLLNVVSCGSSIRFITSPNYDYTKLKNIAILPFTGNTDFGPQFADLFGLNLMEAGFTIVAKGEIDKILEEHGMQQLELMDENQVVKTGKLLGVNAMMFGEIVDARSGAITIRLIDIETAQLIGGMTYKDGEPLAKFEDVEEVSKIISQKILLAIKPSSK